MRRRPAFVLVAAALVAVLYPPLGSARAQGGVAVVVFEGRGLGHGVGLPLDGADHLARSEEASAEEILERFYPDTDLGEDGGAVRVAVAARDDLREGIEVTLPSGGVVRDGRTTAVAPSFPIRVPEGGSVHITHEDGFYRAEVPGDRPVLAASPHGLWLEPRDGGATSVPVEPGGPDRSFPGLVEVVAEAERLHVVNELDVEEYVRGVDLELTEGLELAPEAHKAALIAARTYALRAASTELRVGRFHLHADERSLPYVGIRDAPAADELAAATAGQIIESGGEPIAALITAAAGGRTAAGTEVFGERASELSYLQPVEYPTSETFRWRVDVNMSDLAERLEAKGEPTGIAVSRKGPSGRPSAFELTGSDDAVEISAASFHSALRLPASHLEVTVESRSAPIPARDDAPPFQQLPDEPLGDGAPVAVPGQGASDEGRELPPPYVLGAIAVLGLSLLVFLGARFLTGTQPARARRHLRPPGFLSRSRRPPRTREITRRDPRRRPRRPPSPDEPLWPNEPEWLRELGRSDETTPDDTPEPTVDTQQGGTQWREGRPRPGSF